VNLLTNDLTAREQVLDISRSIILQAPAGSGKTTLLMQRFLRLLSAVDEPEAVLAMTFTRKAAGELRGRIEQALREASMSRADWPERDNPVKQRTLELAARVLEVDRQRGWGLLSTPARLRVQTIDGVNRALASAVPVSAAGIGDLALTTQPARLYREVARRCLAELEADPELCTVSGLVFEHLDNSWESLELRLAQMLQQRARWLPRIAGAEPVELRREIERLVTELLAEHVARLHRLIDSAALRAIVAIARSAADNLRSAGSTSALLPHLERLAASPESQHWSAEEWCALAHFALTQSTDDVSLRKAKGLNVKQGFPRTEKALKQRMQAWLQQHDSAAIVDALDAIRQAPPARFSTEEQQIFAALTRLLLFAAAELELAFRERGQTDFIAVAAAARDALRSLESEGSLRLLHQGSLLQHLLVDEFQDTSQDQYDLIMELTRDWQEGDGRTLFVVGDPMQSIYQFREARVDLFQRACETGIGHLPLHFYSLSQNFRSSEIIVDFVNDCFRKVFPPDFVALESAVPYTPSVATQKTGSASDGVFCHARRSVANSAEDARCEAAAVLELIRALRTDTSIQTIAVLVTARTHAAELVRTLQAADLPIAGVDLIPLEEAPVVKDLLALTTALANPLDRIAWLSVLRAPWCALDLADLTRLVEGAPRSAIIELWDSDERIGRLSAAGASHLQHLRSVLAPLLGYDERSLASKVEAAWLQLGGPVCYAETSALADARRYLDVLTRSLESSSGSIRDELTWLLDGLFSGGEARKPSGAVQVMTIHRAKGLEFDAVIVPSLARKTRGDDSALLDFLEWQDTDGTRTLMAPLEGDDTADEGPTLSRWIRVLQRRRAMRERARLLYVAMTRAKRTLHLFAHLKVKDGRVAAPVSSSPLGILWPALETAFTADFAVEPSAMMANLAPSADASIEARPLHRLSGFEPLAYWPQDVTIDRLQLSSAELKSERSSDPERPPESSRGGTNVANGGAMARMVGIVIHHELERLTGLAHLPTSADLDVADRQRWRRWLHAEGIEQAQIELALVRVATAIEKTLSDSSGRWVLDSHGQSARSEFALTGMSNGRLVNAVIDRTFIHQGVRWVIDYKTGTGDPRLLEDQTGLSTPSGQDAFVQEQLVIHRPQLQRYVQLLQAYDPLPVKAALYFPLLPRLVEIDL